MTRGKSTDHLPGCRALTLEQWAEEAGADLPDDLRGSDIRFVDCAEGCPVRDKAIEFGRDLAAEHQSEETKVTDPLDLFFGDDVKRIGPKVTHRLTFDEPFGEARTHTRTVEYPDGSVRVDVDTAAGCTLLEAAEAWRRALNPEGEQERP